MFKKGDKVNFKTLVSTEQSKHEIYNVQEDQFEWPNKLQKVKLKEFIKFVNPSILMKADEYSEHLYKQFSMYKGTGMMARDMTIYKNVKLDDYLDSPENLYKLKLYVKKIKETTNKASLRFLINNHYDVNHLLNCGLGIKDN